jgi:YfiH family protein
MNASVSCIDVDWPAPAAVRAVYTTRSGGVSHGPYAGFNLGARSGDDPAAVITNRRLLRTTLGLAREPGWLHQVHGRRVVRLPASEMEPEADASFATEAGIACAVLAADCLPVLFCADDASVVAAAHAGWRGLAAGVLEATVKSLPVPASRLLAWLGPAIGPRAFEVGDDVYDAFVRDDPDAAVAFVPGGSPGKWYADIFMLARRCLVAAGVARIYGGGTCTWSDPARFFSFRRDGKTGRQAALIWMAPGHDT